MSPAVKGSFGPKEGAVLAEEGRDGEAPAEAFSRAA